MRTLIAILLFAVPAAAVAAVPTTPGYTPSDDAQQAKLRGHLGTWQCAFAPATAGKPFSFTEEQQGNWFVAKLGGEQPATVYERWSHALQAYVSITIFDSGAMNVAQSVSLDPDNGTWSQVWPPTDNSGRKRFDVRYSRAGDVITSTNQFFNDKGGIGTFSATCARRP
ncbi:MAG TPA: hypothetical protein VHS56_05325 [Candidatus Cybelea sp.]|jgi:hypothetical protein|nr:hypothetical protein [Candidatus Cybelea sp.]